MYNVIIAIQSMSIIGLFLEGLIVFSNLKSRLHAYLFFSCIVNLINNVGYFLELKSTTEEAYFTALQLSYFGRVWIAYSIILFLNELCGRKFNKILNAGLILFHVIIYIAVLTLRSHDMYYTNLQFEMNGPFPELHRSNGLFHHLFIGMSVILVMYGLTILIITHHKEHNKTARKRIMTVLLAMLCESFFFIAQITKIIKLSEYFDLTMIGYTLAAYLMLFAIVRYDLLGAEQLAKEYIVDKLSDGIVAADKEGIVKYFNKPAQELFPELSQNAPEVLNKLQETITKEDTIYINNRIYTPKTYDLYSHNDTLGTIYVLQDNTDLYKHAEELEEMTERANSANKAKSMFLSSMSHEIRTPINAVLGMDEMILRESNEAEIVRYAEDIRTAGRTLLSLINDILDFSKIEEGKMEIIPAQYELSSLINDLVNMIQNRAKKKDLRLNVNVDKRIPHMLYGDEIRIKQCALNILTNAVKYTEKGHIDFSVDYEPYEDEILLKFRIKDTGIGMKSEDMKKLFSPFSRIEEKRNRSIEGTGLGMSITTQLLALMNSELKVESVYGEGSSFSFSIMQKVVRTEPIGDYTVRYNSKKKTKEYNEMFRAPDARILVVDDTPVNLSVIKGLLKKTLVQVDTAESGAMGLEKAAEKRYDMIFIDHMMPEMDGIEMLHLLRETESNTDAICVALTANAVSGAREMYIEEGFTDYLSKPVDGDKLELMLMEYLPNDKISTVSIEPSGNEKNENPNEISKQDPDQIINKLDYIDELDVKSGIKHCGDTEGYLETLMLYESTIKANADEIEKLWEMNDTANAIIKIHALKSTSRTIGAEELGTLAEKLELAGKAGDLQTVSNQINELISRYRALGSELSKYLHNEKRNDDKPMIPEKMLEKAYSAIREFAENFDIDSIAQTVHSLEKYDLPNNEKERFEKIRQASEDFDWDTVEEILND